MFSSWNPSRAEVISWCYTSPPPLAGKGRCDLETELTSPAQARKGKRLFAVYLDLKKTENYWTSWWARLHFSKFKMIYQSARSMRSLSQCIKRLPKTIDVSTRLWIVTFEFVGFSLLPRASYWRLLLLWRHSDLMHGYCARLWIQWSGFEPEWEHCVVFLERHLTLTVPLSIQMYKWVPANFMLG